jgi:hypothetical protein
MKYKLVLSLALMAGLLSGALPLAAQQSDVNPLDDDLIMLVDDEGMINILRTDGTDVIAPYVTDNAAQVNWSPDGQWLAAVDGLGKGCLTIRVADTATWQYRILYEPFDGEPADLTSPTWSPDSTGLAYVHSKCFEPTPVHKIQVVDLDFNRLYELNNFDGQINSLDWSPDGSTFLISGARQGETVGNLFLMPVQGGKIEQLTTTGAGGGVWSPDGTQIVYRTETGSQGPGIYILNLRTRQSTRIAEYTYYFDWSPDGTRILFATHRGSGSEVWLIHPDGTGRTKMFDYLPLVDAIWTGRPNVLFNPGFEYGKGYWQFQTRGEGAFATVSPGASGLSAVRIAVTKASPITNLNQFRFRLEPNTRYRLQVRAYSNTGRDLGVTLQNRTGTLNYGLRNFRLNLTPGWKTFNIPFKTRHFRQLTTDTRLTLLFGPYARNGDLYWIDDVRLERRDRITAAGQLTASEDIVGRVEGPTMVAGAVVTLVDMESGGTVIQTSTVTDDNGNFQFVQIPSGMYELGVVAPAGYFASEPVQFAVGEEPNEPFVLTLEQAAPNLYLPLVTQP